jgi:hypothetical protein
MRADKRTDGSDEANKRFLFLRRRLNTVLLRQADRPTFSSASSIQLHLYSSFASPFTMPFHEHNRRSSDHLLRRLLLLTQASCYKTEIHTWTVKYPTISRLRHEGFRIARHSNHCVLQLLGFCATIKPFEVGVHRILGCITSFCQLHMLEKIRHILSKRSWRFNQLNIE